MPKRILKSNITNKDKRRKMRFSLDLSSFISQTSEDELANKSISIETTTADFSFKKKLLDQEVIQNPNILETDNFLKLDNSPSLSKNKFDDEADPFYDFDEERSKVESTKKPNANKQKASKVATKLDKSKLKFNNNIKNYKE